MLNSVSNKSDARPKPDNEILPQRRKTENLPGGLYFFEDELDGENVFEANVVTCAGWLLELSELSSGEIFFRRGEVIIYPKTQRLGIFYPPFSITRPGFKNTKGFLRGLAGIGDLPSEFPKNPIVFETNAFHSPKSVGQITDIFNLSRNVQTVGAYPKASLLSLRAKRLIDENYRVYPSIARIADRLKVSHEHLTRQFKLDFEMSPNAYLHRLRISDATFRLARGEKIISVSGDVGYNDLSRFYKQFRRSTANSPGFCQSALKTEKNSN
jgi:AraC-like DNA-binding protein